MTPQELRKLDAQLVDFLTSMFSGLGRSERRDAMGSYVTGLLLDGERKSIEPMASRLVHDPDDVQGMRQRLQQCVTVSGWEDREVFRRLARRFERGLPGLEALIIDDTGFPKKGTESVGVARQYSGTLGRTDNCQVAVSLHVAGAMTSGCVGMRLYLPEEWTTDNARRRKVGVPEEVGFARKWEIALELVDDVLEFGLTDKVVIADAGYGDCAEFRDELDNRGLDWVVGVQSTLSVWPPGAHPRVPVPASDVVRPRTRYLEGDTPPVSVASLAASLPRSAFRKVSWRAGSYGRLESRFAAVRVHTASGRHKGRPPSAELWLICEWPKGEDAPTKFYLSSLPVGTSLRRLVQFIKMRWRVERDYQELKQEIGLDHFEGRGWKGFHHHVTLCAVAHGFLALQRALFPPIPPDPPDGPSADAVAAH